MVSYFLQLGAIWIALIAISYPLFLNKIIRESLGVGREIQDISEFPYSCRKIFDPIAEGCEDMWIDHEKRVLYAACAPTWNRVRWTPSMSALSTKGRTNKDHVLMLDLDNPGADGKFGMKSLTFSGYEGPAGNTNIDVHGFSVDILDDKTLRFIMVNHKPPTDESNSLLLDAQKLGANSTIEIFEVERGLNAATLEWQKTVYDQAIYTPNRIASLGNERFYFTNDRYAKTGTRRELYPLHAGGDVTFCPIREEGPCKKASKGTKFKYPNGMVRGSDGKIYVPSSWLGKISVFEVEDDWQLKLIDEIHTGIPIDNLSVDDRGDIYAAAFPDTIKLQKTVPNPYKIESPSTVLRFRRIIGAGGKVTYLQEKVVEDKTNAGIGGITIAVHDSKTGRIFTGGNWAPYISVCEPK